MFSLGVILYVLKLRDYPWKEARRGGMYQCFMTGQEDLFWHRLRNANLDPEFVDLLSNLYKYQHADRFDVD